MATKEQERKALEQIKKIIADLGENSYISMAMDGMIEDAEQNIENDFAMSWKNRAENYGECCANLRKEYDKLSERSKELQTKLAEAEDRNTAWYDKYTTLEKKMDDASAELCGREAKIDELTSKCNQQEQDIIALKAKVFDLMNLW